jgi:hypothetical protein
MKKIIRFWLVVCFGLVLNSGISVAQKIDDERMTRDIEVAENVLGTLIKQELNQQRGFFGMEIKGSYLPGYGVTFRLPGDMSGALLPVWEGSNAVIWNGRSQGGTISVTTPQPPPARQVGDESDEQDEDRDRDRVYTLKDKERARRNMDMDSLREVYNGKIIKAAKDFVLDYGDFISQLGANEKIVVTNQGGDHRNWYFGNQKRSHISVEALRSDVAAFKQGKLTRDQAIAKLRIVNTESVDVKEPDMELLTSIFNRLYRADLSKTYFTEDNIYYERLRDYGVIYYMQVYSGYNADYKRYNMPTVDMKDVDQATRDKKVTELYPRFEQDIKENMLEYGRTLKTLKDDESLIFNIALTKCKTCGIPASLEVSIKSTVLKDYGAGKIDKNAALSKFTVKKGPNQ